MEPTEDNRNSILTKETCITKDIKEEEINIRYCNLPDNNFTSRFDDFYIVARLRSDIISPEQEELYSQLPPSGFGTVSAPSEFIDQSYPACGLFLLGFFCLIPWIFGSFYIKAQNRTARTAGLLSLIS